MTERTILNDRIQALNLRLELHVNSLTGQVTVTGGSQKFVFVDIAQARQAMDLANYVAFNTLVRVGSHLPVTDAAPTGTTEKTYLTPNSVRDAGGT